MVALVLVPITIALVLVTSLGVGLSFSDNNMRAAGGQGLEASREQGLGGEEGLEASLKQRGAGGMLG